MGKPVRVVDIGPPINKVLHWTLIVCTGGLWFPVYWWALAKRGMKR